MDDKFKITDIEQKICSILLKYVSKKTKIIIAVSGGPDSMFLFHILRKNNFNIVAAHFNHRLRGKSSDADEKFVREYCRKTLGKQCRKETIYKTEIGHWRHPVKSEALARNARYKFLRDIKLKYKARYIILAHQRDDQLETVILNFLRGAKWRGLKGMQEKNGDIIRPMLFIQRENIIRYLKMEGISYCIDKSNQDISFKRNKIRLKLIPEIKKSMPFQIDIFLELSKNAFKKYEILEKKAKKWISSNIRNKKFRLDNFNSLSEDLQGEIIMNFFPVRKNITLRHIGEIKSVIQKGITGKKKEIKGVELKIEKGKIANVKTNAVY